MATYFALQDFTDAFLCNLVTPFQQPGRFSLPLLYTISVSVGQTSRGPADAIEMLLYIVAENNPKSESLRPCAALQPFSGDLGPYLTSLERRF